MRDYDLEQKFNELTKDMDVPLLSDYNWFIKNGALANKNHPNFEEALSVAKKLTGYGSFDDDPNYR